MNRFLSVFLITCLFFFKVTALDIDFSSRDTFRIGTYFEPKPTEVLFKPCTVIEILKIRKADDFHNIKPTFDTSNLECSMIGSEQLDDAVAAEGIFVKLSQITNKCAEETCSIWFLYKNLVGRNFTISFVASVNQPPLQIRTKRGLDVLCFFHGNQCDETGIRRYKMKGDKIFNREFVFIVKDIRGHIHVVPKEWYDTRERVRSIYFLEQEADR